MSAETLLAPWTGPLGGLPPFDRVDLTDFEPALLKAMDEKRAEAKEVRNCSEPATFENTLEALEGIGSTLRRVTSVYYLWSHNFVTPALRPIRLKMAPLLSQMNDDLYQDSILFERVQAVAAQVDLNQEQRRLCDSYLLNFRRAGAHLPASGRERIAAINAELSTLYATFSDHVLAEEDSEVTWLNAAQLGGLSEGFKASAKAAATERGRPDDWAITNTRSSAEVFLTRSTERALRETVWRIFYARGDRDNANNNLDVITRILGLRQERATLLGFQTHAHLRLDPTMAKTPERAIELLEQVWPAAKAKFATELEALQALAAKDGVKLDRWDVRYYADLNRRQNHAFDPSQLAEHFQLEKLREGMFWAATRIFGWTFEPLDVPVAHPDIRVWQVNGDNATPIGAFYFDPFARPGKRSGAWMVAYRSQENQSSRVLPVVSNNCNFLKAPQGQATLLSLDEAQTLFHEFGHAIHGLASNVTYRSLAGTAVSRDFVEFPSQLNEHWLTTTELLQKFALHHTTGQPIDPELLGKLSAAANADSGFMTLEFLASAVMDMEMHLQTAPIDPKTFEDEVLARWGLPTEVVMRHRTPHFGHIFASDGYSAGYYSYLWADALVADAAELFEEKGFYNETLAKSLMDLLYSRGDSIDPAENYRAFRGREPEVDALLRDRGFA